MSKLGEEGEQAALIQHMDTENQTAIKESFIRSLEAELHAKTDFERELIRKVFFAKVEKFIERNIVTDEEVQNLMAKAFEELMKEKYSKGASKVEFYKKQVFEIYLLKVDEIQIVHAKYLD